MFVYLPSDRQLDCIQNVDVMSTAAGQSVLCSQRKPSFLWCRVHRADQNSFMPIQTFRHQTKLTNSYSLAKQQAEWTSHCERSDSEKLRLWRSLAAWSTALPHVGPVPHCTSSAAVITLQSDELLPTNTCHSSSCSTSALKWLHQQLKHLMLDTRGRMEIPKHDLQPRPQKTTSS